MEGVQVGKIYLPQELFNSPLKIAVARMRSVCGNVKDNKVEGYVDARFRHGSAQKIMSQWRCTSTLSCVCSCTMSQPVKGGIHLLHYISQISKAGH